MCFVGKSNILCISMFNFRFFVFLLLFHFPISSAKDRKLSHRVRKEEEESTRQSLRFAMYKRAGNAKKSEKPAKLQMTTKSSNQNRRLDREQLRVHQGISAP